MKQCPKCNLEYRGSTAFNYCMKCGTKLEKESENVANRPCECKGNCLKCKVDCPLAECERPCEGQLPYPIKKEGEK